MSYPSQLTQGQRFIQFFEMMIKVFLFLLIFDVGTYIVGRFGGDFLFYHFMIHMVMIPVVFVLIELCFFEVCCNASNCDDDIEKDDMKYL